MYLVVIGVLSLILAFTTPPYRWVTQPAWILACVVAATLAPAAVAWWVSRRTIGLLDRNPADPGIGQFSFGRGMLLVQVALGLAHGGVLACTDWPVICGKAPVVGAWPVAPGMLAGAPFLLSILLVWTAVYPADKAVREIALETLLFRGKPVQPVWPLGRYLMFNLRHQVLFILAPMLLILAARDVIMMFERSLREWSGHTMFPDILLGLSAGAVAITAPVILRRVWVTEPLPDGPLRDRLLHVCRKLRMSCREILVWRSGGMIVNAAVMGVVAPFRYFLITDGMLEQMDDQRIEAVFGHEAGHVKRHHIMFFLLFAFISGCAITIVGYRMRGLDRTMQQTAIALTAGILALKWGVLFGWVSRRFERQADVFGVRTLAAAGVSCQGDCRLHNPDETPDSPNPLTSGGPLCITAAHIFGDTLSDVATLNRIPHDARSWRHGSISSRSRTVVRFALDPSAVSRFERRVGCVKAAILVTALAAGLWAAWDLELWKLFGIAS